MKIPLPLEGYYQPLDPCRPEKRLAYAVMERALRDVLSIKGCCDPTLEKDQKRTACHWFQLFSPFSQDSDPPPFSWQWICSVLSLDPQMMHRQLQAAIMHDNQALYSSIRRRMNKRTFRRVNYEYKLPKRRRAA